MSDVDEKYEPTTDIEQSGVRFVASQPSEIAIEATCERLFFCVESFCGGRQIVKDPTPQPEDSEDEEGDRLDPLFNDDNYPQPFIELIYENKSDIFKAESNKKVIDFTFNCAFSIIFEQPENLNTNIDKLSIILSNQSEEFNKINIKLFRFHAHFNILALISIAHCLLHLTSDCVYCST